MLRKLFSMDQKFISHDDAACYFTEKQKLDHLATINPNGQVYLKPDQPLTNAHLMFVMDQAFALYVIDADTKINHSFFLAGAPVSAAGFLMTDEFARIYSISNNSGHYCPTLIGMLPAIMKLYDLSARYVDHDIEFENHEEANTQGIITTLSLRDLIDRIENDPENKLTPAEHIESTEIIRQEMHKTPPQPAKPAMRLGYETSTFCEPVSITPALSASRFGLNPKGWNKSHLLFAKKDKPYLSSTTEKEIMNDQENEMLSLGLS